MTEEKVRDEQGTEAYKGFLRWAAQYCREFEVFKESPTTLPGYGAILGTIRTKPSASVQIELLIKLADELYDIWLGDEVDDEPTGFVPTLGIVDEMEGSVPAGDYGVTWIGPARSPGRGIHLRPPGFIELVNERSGLPPVVWVPVVRYVAGS